MDKENDHGTPATYEVAEINTVAFCLIIYLASTGMWWWLVGTQTTAYSLLFAITSHLTLRIRRWQLKRRYKMT